MCVCVRDGARAWFSHALRINIYNSENTEGGREWGTVAGVKVQLVLVLKGLFPSFIEEASAD